MSQNARPERARKAAEQREAQQRREKMRRNLNIGGVVLVVLLLIGGALLVTQMGGGPNTDIEAPEAGTSDYGVTIGPTDAPHQVVIYEDFLCPYCGELEKRTGEQLASLADEGKVLVDYRPFQLFTDIDFTAQVLNAFKVTLDAAGPEAAKAFHDAVYADQPSEAGPYPDDDWLVEKAVDAGAEEADVRPGIEDMSQQAWVDDATQAAVDAGVNSTPTIVVDGEVFTQGSTLDEQAQALIDAVS
jgi:protein-disulfide isomerase